MEKYEELSKLLAGMGFSVAASTKSLAAVRAFEDVGVVVVVKCEKRACEASSVPLIVPAYRVNAEPEALREAVEDLLRVVEEHGRA